MDLNQMYNFVDPKFETQIKCSCTVDDFHGAENLISNDGQKWNRGFMAYRVVKPPVELEFRLCCTIELCSIKIWAKLDSLKSTGFEIHANGDDSRSEYRKVASHFNLQENGIIFINDSIITADNGQEGFVVKPFYSSTRNQLRRIRAVKIIIKQTAKCVPVVKRIEIWGRVSRFATKEQKASVNKVILKMNTPAENDNSSEDDEVHANGTNGVCVENNQIDTSAVTIPEEFLDAITCEIMALPMVLPSGKIIDSSTLVKHTEHEEKWGRLPSDPFTGQPYTEIRKPVLDVHLKSQIDSFLLKNCDMPGISMTARTVGSISKRRKLAPAYECGNSKIKVIKTDFPLNSKIHSPQLSTATRTATTTMAKPSSSSSSSSSSTSPAPSSAPLATSQQKTQSLDEEIRRVLKVGKYTAVSAQCVQQASINCFQCSGSVNNMLYTITTCSHLICRKCLIDENLNTCKCGMAFNNINVKKYH